MEEPPKRHIACGICRRRKLKCDGRKPTCSTCQRLNQVCEYSDVVRKAGPKRGYVRSLETRIAQLEKILAKHNISESEEHHQRHSNGSTGHHDQHSYALSDSPTDEPLPPQELVQELTEAFFLKINIIHGVLDRKKYTASLGYPPAHQPPPYLQYVVMAYAATLTPKYRSVKSMLYDRAIKYLTKAELAFVDGTPSIYYIIALGLMAHYKTREGKFRLAWLDIGKAWRAIIMLSLNMLDAVTWDTKTFDTPAVAEARRAFWFIYFCDRAGTLGVSLPPIINPDDVFVKLPMDDEAFLMSSTQGDQECFKLEELLHNPNLFVKFSTGRVAFTICLVELNYQILEMGRFPKKNKNITAQEWFNQYTNFDNILQKLVTVVPLVPPVPASGDDEDNKVIIAEKSRRTAVLIIYLWSQAGILFSARTGLHGAQQFPMILAMANPGRLIQRALMSMLEVLLVTRNPHDLEVIGMHPVHPYILFTLAVVIIVLSEHNLVSLDNFKAPVEYIMTTLVELTPIMPCSEMFSGFLAKLAPHFASRDSSGVVNRVEDVLQSKGIDLSMPNFLDGNPHTSSESSPLSILSEKQGFTPSPQNPEAAYTPMAPMTRLTPTMARGYQPVPQHHTPQQPHPQHHQRAPVQQFSHASPEIESPSTLMHVYEEPFQDTLLDLEPPIYLPDVKNELDLDSGYDKIEWAS